LAATVAEVTEHLENFRYSEVAKSLYEFSWSEFCDWYVEMAKLRLKNPATRATAQCVLATVLDYLLRLLHPVMPFVTEQIWQALAELAPQRGLDTLELAAKSVMIAPWPVARREWRDVEVEKRMARLQELIKSIRNIRSNFNVDNRSPVAVHVRCSATVAAELRAATPFIEQLSTVNSLEAGPDVTKPADSVSAVSTDWELYVPLTGLIDRPAEIERNRKQLDSITAQLRSFQSKLANADFVSKAPPDVVELHRQREAELQAQRDSIGQILRELGGAA
jgi:valyl-tRNA synthetase